MKKFHSVLLSVYIKPEDHYEDVKSAFLSFFSFDFEKEKIKLEEKKVQIVEERYLTVLEVKLEKQRHVNVFLHELKEKISENDITVLLNQLPTRIDDQSHFFLRFDKQLLIDEKRLVLTDDGNCFHLNILVASFPQSKDRALLVVEDYFSS